MPGHTAPRTAAPLVTVVIPVLFDVDAARRLLAQIPDLPELDVVIVDGDADPELDRLVERDGRQRQCPTRLARTTAGRGRQMNAGADASDAAWLLFLHADSVLPDDWLAAFRDLAPTVAGGWFRFALDDTAWQARIIERMVAWRVRYLRLPYGDQGLFVRRSVFESMGGFREWPLLEDVDFVRRLVRAGTTVELPLPLVTSARRWRRDGWFRRSAQNALIVLLYFAGWSPAVLARWYHRGRRPPYSQVEQLGRQRH